ncbi:MAG: O-antigen ligase family protein, partial [Rhodocyclales bacterium]|nr:O-antigen ligase family protein [Rhodocyclales bacterium]
PAPAAMTWFWQAWIAAIVFIFPIPHTIALRNLVLLIGLLILLATLRRTAPPAGPPQLRSAAWGLVAITAWLVFHSIAVSPAPTLALDNLRGDWLLPLLTAALAAFAATRTGSHRAIRATFAALLAHMLWVLGWQFWLWVTNGMSGGWPAGAVPFGERDYQSSLNGFLVAILIAERLAVLSVGPVAALFPGRLGWAALAVSLVADIALRTRNGTVVSLVLLLAATVWMARRRRHFLLLLLVAAALGGASFALDSRWSGLKESIVVGWNSPSVYWMSGDPALRPPMPSGADLEESAYLRAAWSRQAVLAIGEHPLGLGFGRDGFGRVVAEKYNFPGMVSSHSGWLDFALGAGLPGLALLLFTSGLAIRGGWRQFRQHDDVAGLMFSFLTGGYLLRCLLDGHLSGWRLGLFAFICGVLVAAMKNPRRQP